jgi:hypothetical protein
MKLRILQKPSQAGPAPEKLRFGEEARIELLFDGDGYRGCEANSNPGFRSRSTAPGDSLPQHD